jgi:hypothetical protein
MQAARVPGLVRHALGIEAWLVPDVGSVHPLES